jgi:hypothetical protein
MSEKPKGKQLPEPEPEVIPPVLLDPDHCSILYVSYSLQRSSLDVAFKSLEGIDAPTFHIGQRFSAQLTLRSGRRLSGINLVVQLFTQHPNGRSSLRLQGPRGSLTLLPITNAPAIVTPSPRNEFDYSHDNDYTND